MPTFKTTTLLLAASLAGLACAKTDIGGCVSKATTNEYGYAVLTWYVPDTYEVCEILDCGGGRAPPKTTVPGCAAYEGTETYSPKYLTDMMTTASATSTAEEEVTPTGASSSAEDDEEASETAEATETADPTTMITAAPATNGTVTSGVASTSTGDAGAEATVVDTSVAGKVHGSVVLGVAAAMGLVAAFVA